MAKQSTVINNDKREKKINLQRKKREELKKISNNVSLSFEERLEAQIKLSEMPRNGAKVRYRKRCALTGRPRGYVGKFKLSRIMLRELASWGHIPGLLKSSW